MTTARRSGGTATVASSRPRRTPASSPAASSARAIAIECVSPSIDDGRHAVKRLAGDQLGVEADIFKDGHDLLAGRVRYRGPGDTSWRAEPLTFDYNRDRWGASIELDRVGEWRFIVEAWTDTFGTWRSELEKKVGAGQDVSLELEEGALMVDRAAKRVRFGDARSGLMRVAARLRDASVPAAERERAALAPEVDSLMREHAPADDLTTSDREYRVTVDRPAAGFAAWYEMFPRSYGAAPGEHGTFRTAIAHLPRIAAMGFDVLYLPPIHPIGRTFRKGRNNSLTPTPDDVGSPWAIGNEHGGHDAIEPALGDLADFDAFVAAAGELGLEVALDYALQCSPDHPWVKAHPEWFHIRPDGSIKYAENPPKKYQDIYPINFWCEDREHLWQACRDVLLFWIGHGVRTFRVDNPHTKPFAFWEWTIAEVKARHPDVVFLSEAFTRPKRMKHLAKLGFSQSYTYFTWKNTAAELREYFTELTEGPAAEYFRGNLFANTPDILHEYLQHGGRPAFRIRLLLAATLSPLYGIYSGYELSENVPVRAGSEEYLDSEKYQLTWRDWDAAGNLSAEIALLNRIRREHPALQTVPNLAFHRSENDQILFYRRHAPGDELLIAVNLDPHRPHESMVHVPVEQMGFGRDEPYIVEDLLTGARYTWRGSRNYVRLDPSTQPGHLLRVVGLPRRDGGGAVSGASRA